ncbi:ribonuclease H-like domain-containing protein [Nemania sp. FL0916]|nr:ribonuclease H-like domain-containing protein [Nemania sp. FL0916]
MVYIMEFYVDGGCRGNGKPWAIGAAACCLMKRNGNVHASTSRALPRHPVPTNQRAEITAIILALEWALERYDELHSMPDMDIRIFSDSKYAVDCMNTWIYKWVGNGWFNARGCQVANRDLIQEASELDDKVKELGSVTYNWVSRSHNQEADQICNDKLDELENDSENDSDSNYDSDYDSDDY